MPQPFVWPHSPNSISATAVGFTHMHVLVLSPACRSGRFMIGHCAVTSLWDGLGRGVIVFRSAFLGSST
jgi:hypothetical protein